MNVSCDSGKRGAVLGSDMADDPTTRRSLARVVEGALYFFGVANVDQFEVLLDDADQRAMLRAWLRSTHCPPRDAAAGMTDSETQTTVVDVPAAAAAETREVGSMATFSPSGARLVSVASQAVVRVAQRESQANVAVPVADAAVGTAAITANAQTQSFVETVNASTSHYLVLGIGLTTAATQTAFDGNQAVKLAVEERLAELESRLSGLGHSADATTQTDFDIAGLEESLLLSALGVGALEQSVKPCESTSKRIGNIKYTYKPGD